MRTIDIQINNLKQIQELFRTMPERTKQETDKALKWSAILLQRLGRQEAPVDKGRLRSSINIRYLTNAVAIGPQVNYAYDVHEGTGIFGPRKQRIYPKHGKVLAWQSGGQWHYAKSIKGQKANPFMDRAANIGTPDIQRAFEAAVERLVAA